MENHFHNADASIIAVQSLSEWKLKELSSSEAFFSKINLFLSLKVTLMQDSLQLVLVKGLPFDA
ncbi:hypothetical protein GOP47_0014387, partial [Adiantum capillus-veneris]